ncbi:MAG: hypothetical protein ACE5JA_11055 [bacterium]
MKDRPPSAEEWRNLYDAALEFKNTGCWTWMWDTDIFGVQNPADGEIGYCCVMGRAGRHFAMAVYLGTEGLEGYLKTQSQEMPPSSPDFLHVQKCLAASFEDREFLQKADFNVIKELGLKFRGRNSWPLFRSYQPGYFPWYLTGGEARYLALCLLQAIDVSLRFKDDPDMLTPPVENRYLVRVTEKGKRDLSWKDEWLEPSPLRRPQIIVKRIDAESLERMKRMSIQPHGDWEVDFFYFPGGVGEKGERPCFPYVFLCVDRNSGLVLTTHVAEPQKWMSEFPEGFLRFMESSKSLPEEIFVKKDEVFKLLEPIASRLGVRLRRVRKLKALENAQAGMFERFAGGDLDA